MPYTDSSSKKGSITIVDDVNNRSVSATDQKMLKLRIKVGSNSVSASKNAAIYSGLGLMSPLSSPEDSPSVSGGLSPEFCTPDESPLTVLQVILFHVHCFYKNYRGVHFSLSLSLSYLLAFCSHICETHVNDIWSLLLMDSAMDTMQPNNHTGCLILISDDYLRLEVDA